MTVFLLILLVIGLLLYFIPEKTGHPKVAKYLTIGYVGLLGLIVSLVVFEDSLFTKNDARAVLMEQDIVFTDKFELLENKSISGYGDNYHTFTLQISERDKQRVIDQIKDAANFQPHVGPAGKRPATSTHRRNYETREAFVREYSEPGRRPDDAPMFHRISIDKASNKLVFEDIDE